MTKGKPSSTYQSCTSHYEQFIRLYGCAPCFDSCYDEAAHKFLLKEFYKRTNKNNGFELEILEYKIRWVKSKAMDDLLTFRHSRRRTIGEESLDTHITQPSEIKNMFSRFEPGLDVEAMARYGLNPRAWRSARWMSNLDSRDFIDALAVYVREKRRRLDDMVHSNANTVRRAMEPAWVEGLYVAIHESVACWVPDGKHGDNTVHLTKMMVRCAPDWRKSDKWRRDHVWILNDPPSDGQLGREKEETGREIGQLRLIISIADYERP